VSAVEETLEMTIVLWWSDEVEASEENREMMTKQGISDLQLQQSLIFFRRIYLYSEMPWRRY
jgi:hypothetical protein